MALKKRFNPYSIEQQMEKYGLSRKEAEEKVLILKLKRFNPYSIEQQMEKYGLSRKEAEEKIIQIKKKGNVNVWSIKFQMEKYGLSKKEAEEKIENSKRKMKKTFENMTEFDFKSMSPKNKEHWIKKGFSEKVAIKKAAKQLKKMQNVYYTKQKENPEKYEARTQTQLKYWLKKGYSKEESKEILAQRQATNSLEKQIKKYGEIEGKRRWEKRNEKWSKKIEKMYKEGKFSKSPSSNSKVANKFFTELVEYGKFNNKEYYCAINGKEFFRRFTEVEITFAYDFVHKESKVVIEFNGDIWHGNPKKYKATDKQPMSNKLYEGVWERDRLKKELIEQAGYKLIYVWEYDYYKNPKQELKKCLNFIKENMNA